MQPMARQDVLDCPTIPIVDDDVSIRVSLMDMFDSLSIPAATQESGDDFLTRVDLDAAGCILVDIHMPDMSGLYLQRHLASSGNIQPIVFMTGCATIAMSVQAMKLCAFDFLLKHLEGGTVVATADNAIQLDADRRAAAAGASRHNVICRKSDWTRARGNEACRHGAPQQAYRARPGCKRDDDQDPQGPDDEEDAGRIARRLDEDVGFGIKGLRRIPVGSSQAGRDSKGQTGRVHLSPCQQKSS